MTDGNAARSSRSIAPRIQSAQLKGIHLHAVPMPVSDVVTWRGSFRVGPNLATGEELLQELTVSLLEKGTSRRDRFEISEFLDDRGAHLDFQSDGLRVAVSGRALRRYASDVIGLMAELLFDPVFDEQEFQKARAQLSGSLRRALDSTARQASVALAQGLYLPSHPNYTFGVDDELSRLESFTVEEVRAYHRAQFGNDALSLVFSGDVDMELVQPAIEKAFDGWAPGGEEHEQTYQTPLSRPGYAPILMEDRRNLDVRLGHTVPLRRQDPDFIPLYVATFCLGGNFSARLMTRVRDEKGLTYGIGAALVGVEREHDGHWQVAVTLSDEKLELGLEATREEVEQFVQTGVAQKELEEKQGALVGSYSVSLATTGGMASAVLSSLERGLGLDYVDRFPKEVRDLSIDRVNESAKKYIEPDRLFTAVAGTLPQP